MKAYRFAFAFAFATGTTLVAAPVPKALDETVTDRKAYWPNRAYQVRAGKVVGIVVSDVGLVMEREGRSSQSDALGFSSDGGSYNWIYVPVDDANPQINNLKVRTGTKGDETVIYPKLGMATLPKIAKWGVKKDYSLAEIEVNDGKGAPADEAFVATKMTVQPFEVNDCVSQAHKLYEAYKKDNSKSLDSELAAALKKGLGVEKATGPRKTETIMHVTWLTKQNQLVVTFLSRTTDGAYKFSGGGAKLVEHGGAPIPGGVRPPPPQDDQPGVRYGKQAGIEFGRRYTFDNKGTSLGTQTLAPEGFQNDLPPPPAGLRKGLPLPLPPVIDK